jgi:hypothetical protein
MNDHDVESEADAQAGSASIPAGATAAIPERPFMPAAVVSWLEARLRETQCFLEYGAGGSTRLAASLGVPRIISVESDRAFALAVKRAVAHSGSASILNLVHADIGPTKEWGYPADFRTLRRWPNYALGAWDYLRQKDMSPDLVLIDGRFRLGCFLISLLEARPGTVIAFDDYVPRREFYGAVERFVRPSEVIDRCAIFHVPKSLPERAVARALARYVSLPD